MLHSRHGNKMMIQSECTFWHFLSLTLIPGRQGLIQTDRYSFHREYIQPCFLLVTAIFGVFSESGVISHTPPHVLTSVLWGVEEVSILFCLQIKPSLPWKVHAQTITPIFTWSKTDRWIVRTGLKKGEEKKWRSPLHCEIFFWKEAWITGEASDC